MNALHFWRQESKDTIKPLWLFLTENGQDRLVGIGFLGLLLIWRSVE